VIEVSHIEFGGKDLFQDWFDSLDIRAQASVDANIQKLRFGKLKAKPLRAGVAEIRIKYPTKVRVYIGWEVPGVSAILILGGYEEKQQKDINRAIKLWQEYRRQ
jgi:putative addiction module killer protein